MKEYIHRYLLTFPANESTVTFDFKPYSNFQQGHAEFAVQVEYSSFDANDKNMFVCRNLPQGHGSYDSRTGLDTLYVLSSAGITCPTALIPVNHLHASRFDIHLENITGATVSNGASPNYIILRVVERFRND